MKLSRVKYNPKKASFLIFGICLTGMLIGNYVERFRFSDLRWIYQYGKYLNLIMVFSSIGWSFFHPFIVRKDEWKRNVIWILIGLIPFLYISISMLL